MIGVFVSLCLELAMDNITFWVCLWNFSAIVSIFHSFISINIKYIIILLVYLFLSAWNWRPMDNITFWVCLWNFSAIGIVSIFH